jgi:cupin fold WbuC family metalloprotein
MTSYRRALDPPAGDFVVLGDELAQRAVEYSRTSPRKRVILPFHKHDQEPLHRMLNAVQPGSYLRPHRHLSPPKAEVFIVLRGALALFVFEDDGRIRRCLRLAAGSESFGVDLAPGLYHSFFALEPDTLLYEVKSGPYVPATAKDFAPWAPEEGAADAQRYLAELQAAFARVALSATAAT